MKQSIQNFFMALAILAGANHARGVTFPFATLYAFSWNTNSLGTNSDGAYPYGGLVLSGDTLYGTASGGGTNDGGTVFAVNTNMTSFATVHTFSLEATNGFGTYTNSDGGAPGGDLVLSGAALYGMTEYGGTNGNGTVYAVNTNGTGFRILHTFTALDAGTDTTNADGAQPYAGLILSGGTLFGTAEYGGTNGNGTVFAVNTNGGGFRVLYTFTALDAGTDTTNSDGAEPLDGLILSGDTLFGTTAYGGTNGNGTVFGVNTNGSGFQVVHTFTALDAATETTNSDGANPIAGLVLSGNTLYGTAYEGGANGQGTVFGVNTNGSGFQVLHAFMALDEATETTNDDGANPVAGLVLSGNNLYGTAYNGGDDGYGTVFGVTTNGTNFIVLHTFSGGDDGANPVADLILSNGVIYGTAEYGGADQNGTVFALSIMPLSVATISSPIRPSDGQFEMFLNGVAGQNYTLQMSTNLNSTNWTTLFITNNAATNSFYVTDPNATNSARFYRFLIGP